jgi:glycogen debranching enzyme
LKQREKDKKEPLIISPEGEKFEIDAELTNRILNEGVSLALGEPKEGKLVLKEGDCFLFTNLEGDIPVNNQRGFGLYYKDTRFLSTYTFTIDGNKPVLLHSTAERNYVGHIESTNVRMERGKKVIPQHTLNIRRLRAICNGLYERIRVKSYNDFPVKLNLEVSLGADFADIFEVRGLKRPHRGVYLKNKVCEDCLILAYVGEDEIFRETRVCWGGKPKSIIFEERLVKLIFEIFLSPQGRILLDLFFQVGIGGERKKIYSFNALVASLRKSYLNWEKECTGIETDNELFNVVVERARNDLRQLYTQTRYGGIVYGGIPWFAAPFGRDSLITAFQTLTLKPDLARGALSFCAKMQGTHFDSRRDEEPGKIFHEIRQGELAQLEEIPQTPYYGSVDATLLFLILAADYFRWTGDIAFLKKIERNVNKGFHWLENLADVDGDGLVEYLRRSKRGLTNQGWKDSWDAILHRDGKIAEPPIALVEVQAYAYAAWKRWADILLHLGKKEKAKVYEKRAEQIKEKFEELFFWEEENFYYLALDGKKNPVEIITSNPGHALWAGIVSEERAQRLSQRLLHPDLFSGWGIRTVSKASPVYNPMGYHRGTVWPHDNSFILYGLKRYGFDHLSNRVATGLFEMVVRQKDLRFPELFCGFTRRGNNFPVNYPVACVPQAWAAGSVFLILQSILGIEPYAYKGLVKVRPFLPSWLSWVKISGLRVGGAKLDLLFHREGEKSKFEILEQRGSIIILEERGE